MSRVFLDRDDSVTEYAWFDDTTGDLQGIERVGDAQPIVDWCKERANEGLVDRKSEFRLVARYDPEVLRIWCKQWGLDANGMDPDALANAIGKDDDLTRKLLADYDLSKFRTLPGTY